MTSSSGTGQFSVSPSQSTPAGEVVQEGVLELQQPFGLYYGGTLSHVRVAWRLAGAAGTPIVVALGGISAHRQVYGDSGARGWWDGIVGPNQPLDTTRVRVLGLDYLGGSGGTTGPKAEQRDFPSISAFDQAELLERVRAHLGIEHFAAIAGASYGGMVALAYAARYAGHVRRLIVISAAHRTHPMATAWRSVQREVVRFAVAKGDSAGGLRLARALAMATYRTPGEFADRFCGEPSRREQRFEFPVERYLLARGDAYALSYRAESFVCVSESIDLHRIDPSAIRTPVSLVAVREDQLVPLADMRELGARLAGESNLIELSSPFGHDAFLKESQALAAVFAPLVSG
ncbi:MAG: homoserine O-succinyltransferase, partial [Steroidobacteraceae bacterium]